MLASLKKSVCAIVLCYGDRLEYLEKTLDAINKNKPGKIALIANDVSNNVLREIERRKSSDSVKYFIVISKKNIGSSGGYSLGLDEVLNKLKYEYLWLLDDDNCPEADALDALLTCHEKTSNGRSCAIAARRVTPGYHDRFGGWTGGLPKEGTCVGFHVFNYFNKLTEKKASEKDVICLPWSVYGGLLIPSELARSIGLPKKDFFLYGDDLEWTLRITRSGKKIFACPKAIIHDLSPSWNAVGGKGSNLRRRIQDLDSFRVYYEVRNRTWINRQYYPGKIYLYFFNKTIFMISAWVMALRYARLERFRLIKKAIRDGEMGRLGASF